MVGAGRGHAVSEGDGERVQGGLPALPQRVCPVPVGPRISRSGRRSSGRLARWGKCPRALTALVEVGRRGEALAPAREAVDAYRGLLGVSPAAHRPNLATSLHSYAIKLAEVGPREMPLTSTTEAVALHRSLFQMSPAAHRDRLLHLLVTLLGLVEAEHKQKQIRAELAEVCSHRVDPDDQPSRPV